MRRATSRALSWMLRAIFRNDVFGQHCSFIEQVAQSVCQDRKMIVSAFVTCERWFLKARHSLRRACPVGQSLFIQRIKVLTDGASTERRITPVDFIIARYATLSTGVCLDNAGVHSKTFALDQPCVHAATQHVVEQPAKQRAVAKTPVAVLGKRRVIGDFVFEAQRTEPAIRKV